MSLESCLGTLAFKIYLLVFLSGTTVPSPSPSSPLSLLIPSFLLFQMQRRLTQESEHLCPWAPGVPLLLQALLFGVLDSVSSGLLLGHLSLKVTVDTMLLLNLSLERMTY